MHKTIDVNIDIKNGGGDNLLCLRDSNGKRVSVNIKDLFRQVDITQWAIHPIKDITEDCDHEFVQCNAIICEKCGFLMED